MRLAKTAIRGIPAGRHWHNTAWYTKFSFGGDVHYSARTWPDPSSPKQYASSHPECPTPCAPAAPLEPRHRDLQTNLCPNNRIRPATWCVSTRWRIRHWSAISRETPPRSVRNLQLLSGSRRESHPPARRQHAHASNVLVDVPAIDGGVRVSVSDDGVGGADPSCGSGLLGCETASTRSAGRYRWPAPPRGPPSSLSFR
jgi:hypothetical protein